MDKFGRKLRKKKQRGLLDRTNKRLEKFYGDYSRRENKPIVMPTGKDYSGLTNAEAVARIKDETAKNWSKEMAARFKERNRVRPVRRAFLESIKKKAMPKRMSAIKKYEKTGKAQVGEITPLEKKLVSNNVFPTTTAETVPIVGAMKLEKVWNKDWEKAKKDYNKKAEKKYGDNIHNLIKNRGLK